jgi:Phytanoyl-CoA dioxygenase (PhyH)
MPGPLSGDEIAGFIRNGYVRLKEAFSADLAKECRRLLWEQLSLDPAVPAGWSRPVVFIEAPRAQAFCRAANTRKLYGAFDQLVGAGRWVAHPHLAGKVVVRFPVDGDDIGDGWHIDTSFERDGTWFANVRSDGRALLMLFLLSDVGPDDAPTRIRRGSHLHLPALLAPDGDTGLSFDHVSRKIRSSLPDLPIEYATGQAGDVYLCHPFLVHAAQRHRGTEPRFLGQPGLLLTDRLQLSREDGSYSPVEEAIRRGLGLSGGPGRPRPAG